MKKLVVSTGAGMSAESGIATFRDAGGLWENYPVMDVASADGFARNPALIHKFYNERRKELFAAEPNAGHRGLVDLEKDFDVRIITQNVDNLHERAGSSNVLHLHGQLDYVRALDNEKLRWRLTPEDPETTVDTVIEGHHVRPDIVFFRKPCPISTPPPESWPRPTSLSSSAPLWWYIQPPRLSTMCAVVSLCSISTPDPRTFPRVCISSAPEPAKVLPDWPKSCENPISKL